MSLAPTSPRLPSPPPAAEIQMTPSSPSGGPAATLETSQMEQTLLDASSRRRIHPGTKATDMAAGPPLIPLHELDSAFQLQEHLAALHFYHTASNTQPLTRATAIQLAQPPSGIDRTIWLYELCRFLISQCNSLIVGFLFDTPPCSASTCPEMRASEWQFLCAVHEQPKSCCAIDYCCHTLDWAANVVTDQKIFPSRFVVISDNHSKNVGVKNLVNVFRRLHRIFAHAWFQHRGVFWSVEGQTGLYVFFKSVCDLYDLLPAENYKLPPEAEGLEQPSIEQEAEKPISQILKPPTQQRAPHSGEDNLHPTRTNTRRHIRSSPSTGSAVTTVMEAEAEAEEEDEEGADGEARKMREMHIAPPATAEDESGHAEISVVVEPSIVADSKPQEPGPSTQDKEEDEDSEEEESDADQTIVDIDSGQEPEKQKEEDEKAEDSKPVEEPAASTTETKKDPDSKDEPNIEKSSDGESKDASDSKDKNKDTSESQSKETESKKSDDTASAPESYKEPEPKGKDA